MIIIVTILSAYAFYKTFGYAVYEYTDNRNKVGGIVCGILSVFSLVLPIVITFIK